MANFLYKGVVDWFLQQMSQGELAPGEKMPSLRKLAKQLDLSLNTVIHGYDLLAQEGWIESRPKSGYFVCHKPSVKQAHVLAGDRVAQFQEMLAKKMPWSALSHRAAFVDQSDEFLQPNTKSQDSDLPVVGKGHLAVREAVSEHLRKVAIQAHPSTIWLGRSPLAMYTQALQTLTQKHDTILVLTPCDPRITSAAMSLGRTVMTLAAGERGVDLDEAVRCLKEDDIKLVVFPSQYAFPTGSDISNLSLRRWLAILQQVDIPAIEWDMTSHLGYKDTTIMTYKSLDEKKQVVYIGGVESKGVDRNAAWCLPGRYTELEGALLSADLALSDAQQHALMDALQVSQRHSLMRRARQIWSIAEKAKSILESILGEQVRFAPSKGGLSLWLQLEQPLNEGQMTQLLAKHRHGVVPGELLSAQADADHWLAVNVTYDGLEKLAKQLQSFVPQVVDLPEAEDVNDLADQSALDDLSETVEQSEMFDQHEIDPIAELAEDSADSMALEDISEAQKEAESFSNQPSGDELVEELIESDVNAFEEAFQQPDSGTPEQQPMAAQPSGLLLEPSDFDLEDVMLKESDETASTKQEKETPAKTGQAQEAEKTTKTVYNPMLDLINHDFG